jgi:hypothetical protein
MSELANQEDLCDFHGPYWADHGGQSHGPIHILQLAKAKECVKCERYGCSRHFGDDSDDEIGDIEPVCLDCNGNHP